MGPSPCYKVFNALVSLVQNPRELAPELEQCPPTVVKNIKSHIVNFKPWTTLDDHSLPIYFALDIQTDQFKTHKPNSI